LPSAHQYTLYVWHCENQSFLSRGVEDCLNSEKLSSSDELLDSDIFLPTPQFVANAIYFQTIWIGGTTTEYVPCQNCSTQWATVAFRDAPVNQYGHAQWGSLNSIKH